ncbi:hypothetical protein [Kineosporia sp. R_H_3]|uniref:hypothetical protein n=1 Tax=Kineosporia sp. R_H_3 TaxID=1961848 RepID=UPI00117B1B44|nr:hypothetical protein [Kineosporia sp. R_H_3]MBI4942491.1 hypothetical protein [Actinomycetota bacterium]
MTAPDPRTACPPGRGPVPMVGASVADWTAGYEAGWAAGHHAARTALDDAAADLAGLGPSRAVDTVHARRTQQQVGRRPGEPDHDDPAALAAYRAQIYASWGLPPPMPQTPITHRTGHDSQRRHLAGRVLDRHYRNAFDA